MVRLSVGGIVSKLDSLRFHALQAHDASFAQALGQTETVGSDAAVDVDIRTVCDFRMAEERLSEDGALQCDVHLVWLYFI